MSENPLNLSCINPIRIRQGDKVIYAPCRKCSVCLSHLALEKQNKCDRLLEQYKHKIFLTLTYDEKSVPRTFRLCPTFSVIRRGDEILKYCITTCPDGTRVLYKKDLQNFFKRVRINLKRKFKNEKISSIKYYACAEYGPKTLRPHYHAVVCSNSFRCLDWVRQNLNTLWPFSNLTMATAKTITTPNFSYVSAYVACNFVLPFYLQEKSIRPFCVGSKEINYKAVNAIERIRESIFFNSITTYHRDARATEFDIIPYSDILHIYPKCKRYGTLTIGERLRLYHRYVQGDYRREIEDKEMSFEEAMQRKAFCYQDLNFAKSIQKFCSQIHYYPAMINGQYINETISRTITPYEYIVLQDKLYSQYELTKLKLQYEQQEEIAKTCKQPSEFSRFLVQYYSDSFKELPEKMERSCYYRTNFYLNLGIPYIILYSRGYLRKDFVLSIINNDLKESIDRVYRENLNNKTKTKKFNDHFNFNRL